MARMALLGVPGGNKNLVDCTNSLPKPVNINKIKRAQNPFSPRQ